MMSKRIPFTWGVATSSFQIEGATKEDGRGPSIWDTYCKHPGAIADGSNADRACDHYHRYEEDISLIKNLGVDAYRFSVAWPRIFPEGTGRINQKGLDFYHRLVDSLLAKNLVPWMTLYHWDLPQALQDKGGWANRDSVSWFCDYAETVARSFQDKVGHFILLNEPSITTFVSLIEGLNAPGLQDVRKCHAAIHHQNLCVGRGFRTLKSVSSDFFVGSSYTIFPVRPFRDTPEGHQAREIMDTYWNTAFFDPLLKGQYPGLIARDMEEFIRAGDMDAIKAPLDFVGLQHYSPSYAYPTQDNPAGAKFGPAPQEFPVTDMGWAIDPPALTECLLWVKNRYGDINLVITENGAAMADTLSAGGTIDDQKRIDYFAAYQDALRKAMDQGVKVTGYFIWSLLDNFEWAFGLKKRFGIVYIDYENKLTRIPKASYYWWQERLKAEKSRKTA